MNTKAFVTGWPISHSKSPRLHGFWLKKYKIAGTYEPVAVEPKEFVNFLSQFKKNGFAGGNVTIPHKEVAFRIIKNLDPAASAIGAVNTLWFEGDELHGGNTDAYGFSANLDEFMPRWRDGEVAIVLGAGGAARAIIYALIEVGYKKIHIANRTQERAERLAADFGPKCVGHKLSKASELLGETDLIVNTTSLGMAGSGGEGLPDLSFARKTAIVTDIVYTPLRTPFLIAAEEQGLAAVDGLGMLLHQAVPGFEKWFGIRPEVTIELRNYILEA